MNNRNIISIDIGSWNTKIVVGKFINGNIHITKAFTLETIKDSISDGKLILNEGRADALRKSIVQALSENKVRYKDVIFTIQSTSIIKRELDVPNVKPVEMNSMIRYEIEQFLPIDLNEYIVEYKVLEQKQESKSRILIAALPKVIAEDYINIIHAMNLEPKALDISSNAVSKLFSVKQEINAFPYNVDNTAAFIDMGYSYINILILSKGLYQFSRLIPTGGKELTEAISASLNLTIQEAENIKKSEVDLNNTDTSHNEADINQIAKTILARWMEDIMRVFQYYKTRNANNEINEIYLYGGTSNLNGIVEFVANTANMPVRQVKSLSSVIIDKQVSSIDLEYYLNSIGAIIRK